MGKTKEIVDYRLTEDGWFAYEYKRPALTADSVIFGFDGNNIKVLLVRRRTADPLYDDRVLKLPGAMILENETLPQAAARVLEGSTGLKGLYLKQTSIFSDPKRVDEGELAWIGKYHGIHNCNIISLD